LTLQVGNDPDVPYFVRAQCDAIDELTEIKVITNSALLSKL